MELSVIALVHSLLHIPTKTELDGWIHYKKGVTLKCFVRVSRKKVLYGYKS